MSGADSDMLSEYIAGRDRVQALVLESDEAAAWQVANRWLYEQHEHLSGEIAGGNRPPWLRRYWQRVTRRASYASPLPWRPA